MTPVVSPHVSPVVTSNAPVYATSTANPVETPYITDSPEVTDYESPIIDTPPLAETPGSRDSSSNPISINSSQLRLALV